MYIYISFLLSHSLFIYSTENLLPNDNHDMISENLNNIYKVKITNIIMVV